MYQHNLLQLQIMCWGLSWSCGSWIYNYLCNQCLSPLKFEPCSWGGVLDTTLCDKVCQWLVAGLWFSPGTPVSSTNKVDRQDITAILLKVALNIITQSIIIKVVSLNPDHGEVYSMQHYVIKFLSDLWQIVGSSPGTVKLDYKICICKHAALMNKRSTTFCDKICQWLATGQWFSSTTTLITQPPMPPG